MVKQGAKYGSANGAIFRVIDRVELDGNVWIHYHKEDAKDYENKEFSCYEESFLARFTELPND